MSQIRPKLNDLWSDDPAYRAQFQSSDEIDAVLACLRLDNAASLVDAGCGNGAFAIAAARRHPSLSVHAFDLLPTAVNRCAVDARDLDARRFRTAVAPVDELPIGNEEVDRVLCRSVLHHLDRPESAYAEFVRVLQQDGLLLLQAPCNCWEKSWEHPLVELFHSLDPSHRRHYHRPAEIITGLSDAGLSIGTADCWPFTLNELTQTQATLLQRLGAAERFRLRQINDANWSVELSWIRVVAVKL